MLLVFRQHRLASSATGGASATLPVLFERSEFTGECAELPTESRELCTATRRCREGYRGIPPVLLFFCRHFLFQIKRKCRNAGSIKYSIVARREGRVQILQFHIVTLPRQRVVEVADPYKLPTELPIAMLRCGYGKHDYRSQLITFFYIATVRVIDKSQFIKPKYSTLLYTCSNINKADLRTPH